MLNVLFFQASTVKQNVLRVSTVTTASTYAVAITIHPATLKRANASVTKAGPATIVRNHAQKVSTAWVVRKNVQTLSTVIKRATMSVVIMCAVPDTLVSPVSIPVRTANTVYTVARIARAKTVPNAIILAAHVNVPPAGWGPIVMCRALMDRMDRIVAKIASAKIKRDVAKMMATVFAIRDGWAHIAMTFVQRVSMANIAWNSVRVRHHSLHAMRHMVANVGKVLAVWIV